MCREAEAEEQKGGAEGEGEEGEGISGKLPAGVQSS